MSAPRVDTPYLREIGATPLLTSDEERELAGRVAAGDPEARDLLVRANLKLVMVIARGYRDRGLAPEDLIAEGNLGLIRAAEGFDPSVGVRFSTYANYWIKQSIRRALQNQGRFVRLPAYTLSLLAKWKRASAALEARLGRTPTAEEVGRRLGLPRRKILVAVEALDAERRFGPGREGEAPALDASAAPTESPEASLARREEVARALEGLGRLGEREAAVVSLRFGLGGEPPASLREAGRRLGMTYERVRQIERIALARLVDHLGG